MQGIEEHGPHTHTKCNAPYLENVDTLGRWFIIVGLSTDIYDLICLMCLIDMCFVMFLLGASIGYAGLQTSEVYRLPLLPSADWTFRFSTATSGRWDIMAFVSLAWMKSQRLQFLFAHLVVNLPACFPIK